MANNLNIGQRAADYWNTPDPRNGPRTDEMTALIERLLKEERINLGDMVAVRALLERCAANAGEADAALTTNKAEGEAK